MAFGDGTDDAMLQAAWHEFCKKLADAGDQIFKDHNPPSGLHRADALRFLTQNLGQAFDLGLETRDPAYPEMHQFCTPYRKLGGDAADFSYQQAWIDGQYSYRIYGTRGTARFFNLTVQGHRPETIPGTDWPSLHDPFGDIPEANIFGSQIVCAGDGSFELFIGGPERTENWLPTSPQSRKLFIRQGFDSWDETPWRIDIERIGTASPKPPPNPDDMAAAIHWAGNFVGAVMRDWPDHPYAYSGGAVDPAQINQFPAPPGSPDGADAQRGRAVANMVWRLNPDEALIISFAPGDSFWMASLGGVFMNSLDYLYRSVSFTPARSHVDDDGVVRLVLCAEDPGYHNWLDSCGFDQGNVMIRTLQSPTGPRITCDKVPRARLSDHLPETYQRINAQERAAMMIDRVRAIRRQRLHM